jgi:hypothetical protein
MTGHEWQRDAENNAVIKAWLPYIEKQLHVFPVHGITPARRCTCGDATCLSPGKHPCINDWEKAATFDPAVIKRWLRRFPTCNIGWALGRDGCGAPDVDPRHGGDESFARLEQKLGCIDTARQKTGGGGEHHIVRIPPGVSLQSKTRAFGPDYPGVDFKTEGGYIVVAPSLHASGSRYAWDPGSPGDIQTLPDAWLEALLAQQNNKVGKAIRGVDTAERVPLGQRRESLKSYAGRLRHNGTNADAIYDALLAVATRQCDPPYTTPDELADLRRIADDFEDRYAPTHPLNKEPTPEANATEDNGEVAVDWQETFSWPNLSQEALYGVAGEFVRAVSPYSESDPAALLAHILVTFCAMIGLGPYVQVEATKHRARLFVLVVGRTSRARKGTARDRVEQLFRIVEEETYDAIHVDSLGSGEGLMQHLADRTDKDGNTVPSEKRALVGEAEFGTFLVASGRDNSILSGTVRKAWEKDRLRHTVRRAPLVVDGAHVNIVGDITLDELNEKMPSLEIANGLLNRFLLVCAERKQTLPRAPRIPDSTFAGIARKVRSALDKARLAAEYSLTPEALALWEPWYRSLPDEAGLLGAVTARAEAQVTRLGLVYALLDEANTIGEPHMRAAMALWDYCHDSAEFVFGRRLGSRTADSTLRYLRNAHPNGLAKAELFDLFNRNVSAADLDAALDFLRRRNLAASVIGESSKRGGRKEERWFALPPSSTTKHELT